MIKFTPPKGYEANKGTLAARTSLGLTIQRMIMQDRSTLGALTTSADQVDGLYFGRETTAITKPWDEAPTYSTKTLRTKIDQLATYVVGQFMNSDPYYIVRTAGGSEKVEDVQTVLHWFLKTSNFAEQVKVAARLTGRRGRCPIRISYVQGEGYGKDVKLPRLKIEPIDTRYFRIYPSTTPTIEEARLCAHEFNERYQWIKEHQKNGTFYDDIDPVQGADDAKTPGDTAGDKQSSGDNSYSIEDRRVGLADCVVRLDLNDDGVEELYHAVVVVTSGQLLMIEPFHLKRHWFADCYYQTEEGRYRPETSVGVDLVDVELFQNMNQSLAIWAQLYGLRNNGIISGAVTSDEVTSLAPGEMMQAEFGATFTPIPNSIDITTLPILIQAGKDLANEVSRISSNGQGARIGSSVTATEVAQIAQGQQAGISDYLDSFGNGLSDIAEIALMLLADNFENWQPYLSGEGGAFARVSKEDFERPYWVEINGDTAGSTPQILMGQLAEIIKAFAQLIGINPMMLQAYPQMVPEFMRSLVELTNLPNKDKILPPRESDQLLQQAAAEGAMNAGPNPISGPLGGDVFQPGMEMAPELFQEADGIAGINGQGFRNEPGFPA